MDSDNDSETTTPDPPPKKVRKVRSSKPDAEGSWRKRTRGRQGSLEQISGMPLDILLRRSTGELGLGAVKSVFQLIFVTDEAACQYDVPARSSIVPSFAFGHSRNRYAVPAYCLRTLRRYKAEMKGLSNPAFQEWHIAKRTEYQAQMEHAGKCEVWNRNRNEERSNELGNIRRRRFEARNYHFSVGGKKSPKLEGETRCEQLSDHKLVKQPRELTDRIWDNIEESLIEFMEKTKVKRLKTIQRAAIQKRGQICYRGYAHRRAGPRDHFQRAMVDITSIVTAWRKSKDEQLVAMMKSNLEIDTEVTEATLRLATTFFRCDYCRSEISYPRILVHRCTTTLTYSDTYEDGLDPYFRALNCKPWNDGRVVHFDQHAHERAKHVLRDCGIDERTTSHIQDILELRFELLICTDPQKAQHYKPDEEWTDVVRLATLGDREALLADLLEDTNMSPLSGHPAHNTSWVCIECKRRISWEESLDHLKKRHPSIIPNDYVDTVHARQFDRYFKLHLDANRAELFKPLEWMWTTPPETSAMHSPSISS
ncbi:hypothetical protein FPV67DRAFT_1703480 [Lyophyllum atratum]|nr:hypothetical protein FPV67DRAFT_1703480 [Lyophyllum atratum]